MQVSRDEMLLKHAKSIDWSFYASTMRISILLSDQILKRMLIHVLYLSKLPLSLACIPRDRGSAGSASEA